MENVNIDDIAAKALELVTGIVEAEKPEEFKHDLWQYAVDRATELSIHFNYDAKPTEILERFRPKEDPSVRDYRLEAYEPVTYSFTRRVLNYLQRLFNPSLFTMSFTDADVATNRVDALESLRAYLSNELPAYGSLTTYLRDFAMERMFSDPNGFVVIFSDLSDSELMEKHGPNELQKPYPKFISSECAFLIDSETLIVESDMKSIVLEGDNEVEKGRMFFVFRPESTFVIKQYGKIEDEEFEAQIWNYHQAGVPMFMQLGGKPTLHDSQVLTPSNVRAYDSHLQPAVPFLNKLISLDSDQSAAYIMHIYLQKWEEEIECASCNGQGKTIHKNPGGRDFPVECTKCAGKGTVNASSGFNKFLVNRTDDGKLDPTPPAGYINLPTDIIKVVEDKLKNLEQRALESLNMGFLAKRETANVESAEAKRQEKDALNTMLETVRKDIDRIGLFVAYGINLIRYGAVMGENVWENSPQIAAPASFELESATDTAEFVKTLGDASVPPLMIREVMKQIATQRFGIGSIEAEKISVGIDLDPLFGMSAEDIADVEQVGSGLRDIDIVIHFYLPDLIRTACENDEEFMGKSREDQREVITALAQELVEEQDDPAPEDS